MDSEPSPSPPSDLRSLRQAAESSLRQALRANTDVEGALKQVEALNVLDQARTRRRNRVARILFAALTVTLVAAVLWLSASRVRSADLAITANSRHVRFTTTMQQRVVDMVGLTELIAEGPTRVSGVAGLAQLTGLRALQLQRPAAPFTLEAIDNVPAGAVVDLERIDIDSYRLTIDPPDESSMAIAVSFRGAMAIAVERRDEPTAAVRPPAGELPQQIVARWAPGAAATLTFTAPQSPVTRLFHVRSLEFDREELVGRLAVRTSTLLTAELTFTEYENKKLILTDAQPVSLGGVDGYLRVEPTERALKVTFSGRAHHVAFGNHRATSSQMPTRLDYLRGHTKWISIFSTIAAAIIAMTAVWTWWRESD